MITCTENVGYDVYGETLGHLWLDLVETILKNGTFELDENRGRYAVRNLRFCARTANPDDKLIEKYGNAKKIEAMKNIFFEKDIIEDFDITPSFRNGAKSYKKRIEDGKMIDFVVSRLTKIPESKKAVMVFPTYEDYEAVITSPWNDYLPCIVALQFRINRRGNEDFLDLTLFMRSWDGYQKGAGDLTVIAMLGEIIRKKLQENLAKKIKTGRLDGFVTDIHIYENTYDEAQQTHFAYKDSIEEHQ